MNSEIWKNMIIVTEVKNACMNLFVSLTMLSNYIYWDIGNIYVYVIIASYSQGIK